MNKLLPILALLFFSCAEDSPIASPIDYCDEIDGEWIGVTRTESESDECPGDVDDINEDISYQVWIFSQENKTLEVWENGLFVSSGDFSSCNDSQIEISLPGLGVYGNATFNIDGNILTVVTIIQGNPSDDCVITEIDTLQQL